VAEAPRRAHKHSAHKTTGKLPIEVFALALAAFAIGTAEFVPNGLLPETAAGLGISVASAGWLTTGYALGVVFGGPIIVLATVRIPKAKLLAALIAMFALANIASAIAPTLLGVIAGRILAGAAHGGFLGVATVVAASLVGPDRQGGAIAAVFTGFTSSNIVGVPLGTVIGQYSSWRAAYWVIAAFATLGLIAVMLSVRPRSEPDETSPFADLWLFTRGQILLGFLAIALGYGGLFASYTYITPLLTNVSGFPGTWIVWLLLLFGIGLVLGAWLAGRLADRFLIATALGFLVILIVALIALGLGAQFKPLTLVLLVVLGASGFGLSPTLQTFMIRQAGHPSVMVSTATNSAFNVGIAAGSFVGGMVLDHGLGYRAPSFTGALLSVLGLLVFLLVLHIDARLAPSTVREKDDERL
jgi:DHA1 family inner membrane transport protein